jgi:hypothetical protein
MMMMTGDGTSAATPSGITYRTSGTYSYGSTTASPVVTKPAGIQDGDLIIIAFVTDTPHVINSVLAGWTQIGTAQGQSTDSTTTVIYKIASSEGETWTFTDLFVDAEVPTAGIVVYDGVSSSTPLDVAVVQGANTAMTTHAAGPITPTSNNTMIVSIFGTDQSETYTGTPDDSPACTERIDFNNASGTYGYVYIQEHKQTTAAEETHQMTVNVSDGMAWFIIALRPE